MRRYSEAVKADKALPAFLPPDQASQQRLPDLLATLRAITDLAGP